MADQANCTDDLAAELRTIESELESIDDQINNLHEKRRELKGKQSNIKLLLEQEREVQVASCNWTGTDFPWSSNLKLTCSDVFHIKEYRPYQLEAMNLILSGKDCILVMPTGGGKSLCYQLPAMISDGISIVVSPLVSLMEDQVFLLHQLGLDDNCVSMSSSNSAAEITKTLRSMVDAKSPLKLLYVTPERISKSKRFMSNMEKLYNTGRLKMLAIDEVHCTSQWGHDFRPDYKILSIMRKQFPNVPILGLTATLTSKVASDVKTMLGIQGCTILKASFNRPNLMYKVRLKATSQNEVVGDIVELIDRHYRDQSGIVYCLSIKDSEDLAKNLASRKVPAAAYHAQLDGSVRSKVHSDWSRGKVKVVVATIAFGMGINKPDVRFVIHHSISKSMENYYQESGRAGRDGNQADCVLFYRLTDLFRLSTMVFKDWTGLENLYSMVAYCLSYDRCRRVMIAEHFGEEWTDAMCDGMCDNCKNITKSKNNYANTDVTLYCKKIYEIINDAKSNDQRLTALKIVDAMLSKDKHKSSVVVNRLSREAYERLLTLLLLEGYLKEDFHFTSYTVISYLKPGVKSISVLNGSHKVHLPMLTTLKVTSSTEVASRLGKDKSENNNSKRKLANKSIVKESKKTVPSGSRTKGVIFDISSGDDEDSDIEFVPQTSKKNKLI